MQPPRVPVLPLRSSSSRCVGTAPALRVASVGILVTVCCTFVFQQLSATDSASLQPCTHPRDPSQLLVSYVTSSFGTQPSLPIRLGPANSPLALTRPTRYSAPKVRDYRGIEALDRRILDFRGIWSTADEWWIHAGLTSFSRLTSSNHAWICGVWAAGEGHLALLHGRCCIQRGSFSPVTPMPPSLPLC
jgi:hypothetical protein